MAVQSEPILTALHYLFAKSGDRIVAHCLDLDLVTSGRDIEHAEKRLNGVVLAQIAACFTAGNYAQLRFAAPDEFWTVLKHAKQLDRVDLEVEVPPVVVPVNRAVTATLPVYRALAEAMAA
jgi:hypothetical protein